MMFAIPPKPICPEPEEYRISIFCSFLFSEDLYFLWVSVHEWNSYLPLYHLVPC
jgi:hypothetical protein